MNKKILLTITLLTFCFINGANFALGEDVTKASTKIIKNRVFDIQNPISLAKSESIVYNTALLIKAKRYEEAKAVLMPVIIWLEDSTEYHASLYNVLKELEDAKTQADIEKGLALKSAVIRDKAIYQWALLNLAKNNIKGGVEQLVKIVKSQPRTELGFKAYEKLQELGFTYKAQVEPEPTQGE
jgi:hypothetical protein